MNSLENRYSRYIAGGISETANNRIEWWERSDTFTTDPSDILYAVENKFAGRLDRIAAEYLGEPRFWWVIAQVNNILDPINEIVPGRIIAIPTTQRISMMLTQNVGGVESSRQKINTINPIIT